MTKLTLKVPVGIGDILLIKAQLDAVKNNYTSIVLEPNMNLVSTHRENNDSYRIFIEQLYKLLFSEKPYEVYLDRPDQAMNSENISTNYGFALKIPRLSSYFCNFQREISDPYITISTKIRYLSRQHYLSFRDKFINNIKVLSNKYKIVLLGEKEIETNNEVIAIGNEYIYSIYSDLISCKDIQFIDKTVPYLYNSPSMDKFKKDCDILYYATNNIVLGVGGNFCMTLSINNILGYRIDDIQSVNTLFSNPTAPFYVTRNLNDFLKKLSLL